MTIGRTDRLVRRTRRRLFLGTLALLVLLVVGIGAATLVMGLRTLDANVDEALSTAVAAQVETLAGELPGAPDTTDGTDGEEHEADEQAAFGLGDTVLLVLDAQGAVLANRTGQTVEGLPDAASMAAAAASGDGQDLRTIPSGDTAIRVQTVALRADGAIAGFVQGGTILALHDAQSRSLVMAVLIVGALGLAAAALITLLVTERALEPIAEGFDAQRQFVADASHELRTPAALIRANAEVLEREGHVDAEGQELLADIIAESDRLGGLVGDLLQLAAWDDTSLAVAPSPVDVAAIAADTVRGATAMAAERGVRLELRDPEGGEVIALADRARIVQLLLILVDNAVDHSPRGGVVTVAVDRPAAEAASKGGQAPGAASSGAHGRVRIAVEDQGPGVPESERERIFQPFTRLSGTTRHGSGGTGLGLAIARRITDAHGGRIGVTSPAGGGARFEVTLPAA